MLFLLTHLYSIQDIMNDFFTILVVEIFSFQTHFISLIFHGTRLNGVNVVFDVSDMTLMPVSKDVLTFQTHARLRNRYVWISLVFLLVAAIIAALVVVLSEAEPSSVPPSKAQLCYV